MTEPTTPDNHEKHSSVLTLSFFFLDEEEHPVAANNNIQPASPTPIASNINCIIRFLKNSIFMTIQVKLNMFLCSLSHFYFVINVIL